MPAASLSTALAVATLVAAPSVIMAGVYHFNGNPELRPFGVTEARIAASDVESTDPLVRVRIFWRGPAHGYSTAPTLADALRGAFETKGIDTRIAIIEGTSEGPTTLDMRAGHSTFGPFPVSEAARHVEPAVQAARFAHTPNATREHRW